MIILTFSLFFYLDLKSLAHKGSAVESASDTNGGSIHTEPGSVDVLSLSVES